LSTQLIFLEYEINTTPFFYENFQTMEDVHYFPSSNMTLAQIITELTEYVSQALGKINAEDCMHKIKSLLPYLINDSLNVEKGI
jgi:hypothetical protein